MAEIKIMQTEATGKQTTVEITGADYVCESTITAVLEKMGGKSAAAPEAAQMNVVSSEATNALPHNMRAFRPQHITPDILKAAINAAQLNSVLQPFD